MPTAIRVGEAAEDVRARRVPLSIGESLGMVRQVVYEDRLLALYHHFFPAELAASKANPERPVNDAYSEMEAEFFHLVDSRFFPMPFLVDYVLVEMAPEERSLDIPVAPWGRDWWNEYDLEPGWQLLLLLAQEFSLENHPHYSLTLHRRPEWPQIERLLRSTLSCEVTGASLERSVAGAKEPLCFLPQALKVVMHDTGNFLLDSTPDMEMGEIEWCVENVQILKDLSEEAAKLLDQVNRFILWLEDGLVDHFREVVVLWQRANIAQA